MRIVLPLSYFMFASNVLDFQDPMTPSSYTHDWFIGVFISY